MSFDYTYLLMSERITWGREDVKTRDVSKKKRIDWREIGKIVLFFADEFIIALIVLYILYRIFW